MKSPLLKSSREEKCWKSPAVSPERILNHMKKIKCCCNYELKKQWYVSGPSTALALTKTPKITPACQNIVAPENGTNVCDGYVDCPDKSDELGCICPENMFKCDCYNGDCSVGWGCIQPILQCNGEVDCVDGSDEKHCNGKFSTPRMSSRRVLR